MGKKDPVNVLIDRLLRSQARETGEINVSSVVDLVRRHVKIDPDVAIDQMLSMFIRRRIALQRDSDGDRVVLACEGKQGKYIDIETCSDTEILGGVRQQLRSQMNGCNRTLKKVEHRIEQVESEQLSMFSPNRPQIREAEAAEAGL